MNKIKNIVIKDLSGKQQDLVEEIKKLTGQKTAAKAIFQALYEYQLLRQELLELKTRTTESLIQREKVIQQIKKLTQKL